MRRRVSFELIVTLEEEEEKGRRQCTAQGREGRKGKGKGGVGAEQVKTGMVNKCNK